MILYQYKHLFAMRKKRVCACYERRKPYAGRGKTANIDRKRQIRRFLLVLRFETGEPQGRFGKCFRRRDMPLLYPRRKMHFSFKNSYEQRLPVRLRILPQQAERRRAQGKRYPRRNMRAYYKLLYAQLYRGAFFVFRRFRHPQPHYGAFDRHGNKTAETLQL